MQEVLFKPDWAATPIEEQEFYELALEETGDPERPHVVRRTHYEWNSGVGQMLPADHILDRARTLKDAENRYAAHLNILRDLGFTFSDMDPIL